MPCAGINGNPFHDITWLAYEGDIPSDATSSRPPKLPAPKLIYFANLHDALKAHMHSKHWLGHANPTTTYYSYYKVYLSLAHKSISNAFWTMFNISFEMKKNIFHCRTGTRVNQKHAVRCKISNSLRCPLCHHSDSALTFYQVVKTRLSPVWLLNATASLVDLLWKLQKQASWGGVLFEGISAAKTV